MQFVKNEYPGAQLGQNIYFRLDDDIERIELMFNAPQEKPYYGWTIEPHIKPCIVSIANNVYSDRLNILIVALL